MSNAALAWAFQQPIMGAAKAVLIALADRVNANGACWPSTGQLAFDAGVTVRSVRREIGELLTRGLILADRSRGRRTSRYVLRMDGQAAAPPPSNKRRNETSKPRQAARPNPDTGAGLEGSTRTQEPGSTRTQSHGSPPPTRTQTSANPDSESAQPGLRVRLTLKEPSIEKKEVSIPPRNSRSRESGGEWEPAFLAFWRLYPRKQGRDDAARAFRSRLRAGVEAATIMGGLARHRFNVDPQYVPYPATWLRRGQWADEPLGKKPDPFDWLERFANSASGPFPADAYASGTIDGEAVQ